MQLRATGDRHGKRWLGQLVGQALPPANRPPRIRSWQAKAPAPRYTVRGKDLKLEPLDNQLIYLDNASTTWPKPESVYRFMIDFYRSTG